MERFKLFAGNFPFENAHFLLVLLNHSSFPSASPATRIRQANRIAVRELTGIYLNYNIKSQITSNHNLSLLNAFSLVCMLTHPANMVGNHPCALPRKI